MMDHRLLILWIAWCLWIWKLSASTIPSSYHSWTWINYIAIFNSFLTTKLHMRASLHSSAEQVSILVKLNACLHSCDVENKVKFTFPSRVCSHKRSETTCIYIALDFTLENWIFKRVARIVNGPQWCLHFVWTWFHFAPIISVYLNAFQGIVITHNASARVIRSNQSLVLQKVTRSSSGNYSCSAINAEGETVSNQQPLRVKCKCFSISFTRLCWEITFAWITLTDMEGKENYRKAFIPIKTTSSTP